MSPGSRGPILQGKCSGEIITVSLRVRTVPEMQWDSSMAKHVKPPERFFPSDVHGRTRHAARNGRVHAARHPHSILSSVRREGSPSPSPVSWCTAKFKFSTPSDQPNQLQITTDAHAHARVRTHHTHPPTHTDGKHIATAVIIQ